MSDFCFEVVYTRFTGLQGWLGIVTGCFGVSMDMYIYILGLSFFPFPLPISIQKFLVSSRLFAVMTRKTTFFLFILVLFLLYFSFVSSP